MPATKEVRIFKDPVLADNNITTIIEDEQGNLFVGTKSKGYHVTIERRITLLLFLI